MDHTNADAVSTKKYFSIAGMRVAMDDRNGLVYLASDHFASTSIVMDTSCALLSELRYTAFGETRYENRLTHPRIVNQPTRHYNKFVAILL